MDIFEIPNQISDYGYGTAGNEDNIEEIGRFELEGHLGSSDFCAEGATSGYGTVEFNTDEIRAEQSQQPTNQDRDLRTLTGQSVGQSVWVDEGRPNGS